jgi:hypothetical protein
LYHNHAPPRDATPRLAAWYTEQKAAATRGSGGASVEVVYVSADRDIGDFDAVLGGAPWLLAVPHGDAATREALAKKFHVSDAAAAARGVLVHNKSGKVVCRDMLARLVSDPENFPWPRPYKSFFMTHIMSVVHVMSSAAAIAATTGRMPLDTCVIMSICFFLFDLAIGERAPAFIFHHLLSTLSGVLCLRSSATVVFMGAPANFANLIFCQLQIGELSSIFLHAYQNVKNQRAVDILGNIFAVMFFATRIVYYTGWLAPSVWEHSSDIGPLLTVLCSMFFGLQYYWFFMIIRKLVRACVCAHACVYSVCACVYVCVRA